MDIAAVADGFAQFLWAAPPSKEQFVVASHSGAYPTLREVVLYSPLAAVVIALLKVVFERALLRPLAKAGLRLRSHELPFESSKLEAIYRKHKPGVPDINEVKSLSSALDKPVEELNKWFRMRQLMDRDVVKVRVCAESMWRFIMYSFCLAVNVSLMWRAPWASDVKLCWEGLPLQPQETSVKLFFVALEIPLYLVLLVAQVTDGRRAKDMWEMTAHHLLVVVLVVLVYLGNFCRIGMIGLALHDVTDLFLESSKFANLFRFKSLADTLFIGFGASWFYARLYKFSSLVHVSVATEGVKVIGTPALRVFMGLLLVLLLLNVYWGAKIAALLYRLMWAGAEKERQQRDFTDLSTDDDVDSDSSYLSDVEPLRRHED